MMKILKKNQLAILVIALMLVTAGYLNYTANETELTSDSNVIGGEQYAAIGDATLVNSGELLEEKDKQDIINTISSANAKENNTINNITDGTSTNNDTKTSTNVETNETTENNYTVQTNAKTDDNFDN